MFKKNINAIDLCDIPKKGSRMLYADTRAADPLLGAFDALAVLFHRGCTQRPMRLYPNHLDGEEPMKRSLLSLLVATLSAAPALADDVPMVSVKRLSMDMAVKVAQGTIEACREKGIQIGVTVVDRNGTVQVTMRDTIAAPITVPISRMKAFTAVNFNAATSALGSRADTPIGRLDGLVMSAGGLPIQVGGALVAGVGVSGAPAGETDEECAQAGVDKVMDDLEMAF